MSRLAGLLMVGVISLLVGTAWAQPTEPPRDQARRLANRGYQLYQEGRYDEANAHFRQAEQLFHAPTLQLMIGRTYEKQGRLADAEIVYAKIADEQLADDAPPEFVKARAEARTALSELRPRVPRVILVLSDPSAADRVTVKVDGTPKARITEPIPVNPGSHVVEISADGASPTRREVELTEGQRKELSFRVPPAPPVPDPVDAKVEVVDDEEASPFIVPMFVAFGVGGVGLVLGTVAGIAALGKQSELESTCPDMVCFPEDEEIANDANTLATVSTVGFVVGGLGVAAGVTFVVLDQLGSGEETAIRLLPTPGGMILQGIF